MHRSDNMARARQVAPGDVNAYLAPAARWDGSDTDTGPHDMRCSIFESCRV